MKRLFVSRHLEEDSPIKKFCADNDYQLDAESLLTFTPVPFKSVPKGDWLFFYSKSGIKHFLSQLNYIRRTFNFKIACFGPSTALFWEEKIGTVPSFIGDGKPENVPTDFRKILDENEVIVFIRAKHSKMSVQKAIEDTFECHDVVAYENTKRTDSVTLNRPDVAMLTSPLNADAFLEIVPDYKGLIITLGSTTSSHLDKHYQLASFAATEITEQGMLNNLRQLIEQKRL